jgi:chaperonin cofactor prefoldin
MTKEQIDKYNKLSSQKDNLSHTKKHYESVISDLETFSDKTHNFPHVEGILAPIAQEFSKELKEIINNKIAEISKQLTEIDKQISEI